MLETKCENETCEKRGDLPICYSDERIDCFDFCDKYLLWEAFKDKYQTFLNK